MTAANPSVLLIHGAFSRGAHFDAWRQGFERAGFSCVAPTLQGHEPSERAAVAGLSMTDYEATLEAIRSRLVTPPVIAGHSMGGLLAQRLAASGP